MSTCRYSENLFPVMECLITLYSVMGRPVGFTAIQKCMGERYGRGHPEQVRRGLNSAHCLGYLKVVEGKYGNKYIPTLKGVVDTSIYWSLKAAFGESIDGLPPSMLFCLIRLARNFALMNRLWLSVITQYLLKDKDSEIEELSLITLKALLGEEVEDLEPRHYREVMLHVELDLANIRSHFTQLGVSPPTRFPSPLESILTKACSKVSRSSA
jgi:hypothetical protein